MLAKNQTYYAPFPWLEDMTANLSASNLQFTIEHILNSHLLLNCFDAAEHFGVKIEVQGQLPITIRKDGRQITVGSFYWQDESECANPAVDLEIGKDGAWYPVNVQLTDDLRTCRRSSVEIDFDERAKQVRFCARWAADLMGRGYDTGEVTDLWGENI